MKIVRRSPLMPGVVPLLLVEYVTLMLESGIIAYHGSAKEQAEASIEAEKNTRGLREREPQIRPSESRP